MASGPITLWQTEGEKVEAMTNFIFLGSKITIDGDCSHEIKSSMLPGRKAVRNLVHEQPPNFVQLCDSTDVLLCPGDSPGKNTGGNVWCKCLMQMLKDLQQREEGAAEDGMIREQHQLNGHEFENSRRQRKTEESSVLQSMGSQRVRQDLATEKQQQIYTVL